MHMVIAQDLSKAASVDVDDMLRFFIAQIVLDKTKPIKDIMPETKEYLGKIRKVVKPIVAASQSREPGSPQYLLTQLTTLYVYRLRFVSISVLIGGAFQSRCQD